MSHGKDNPWFGSIPGIAAVLALPFLLLAWLLAGTVASHDARYRQMDAVLAAFHQGLDLVEALETMRDLAPSTVYLDAPAARERYDAARALADARLATFTATVHTLDNASLSNSADWLQTSWTEFTIDANDLSNTLLPFNDVERFNDGVYAVLSGLFFVSDLAAGEGISANELVLVVLDTLRKARRELGLVRSIAVYTTLRDGYFSSSDAEYLDTAWNTLGSLVESLEAQKTSIEARHPGPDLRIVHEDPPLVTYLARVEEEMILALGIETGWESEWLAGEQALASLRRDARGLLDTASAMVGDARRQQHYRDLGAGIGLVLLYALLTLLSVMLYRSRDAAVRAQADSRAKSLFLARMSHEIRTPLNGVIGLAELLADTRPTPRQREYIELIGSAGRSLVSLVNDILDHAKIEAGKLELERTALDIRALLRDSAQVFGLPAGNNNTLIFCHVDERLPGHLLGDPVRIRQVLLNLVANAVKFTENGRIEITASRVEDASRERPQLRIEVRDTGIGLSQEEQENLFTLFTQASPGVTRRYGGTGLGLSISRELVELMDGRIGVHSHPGAGSVFWFELPLVPLPSPAGHGAAPAPLPPSAPVLVLDNDGHLARAVTALGSRLAQPVHVAVSELDALRLLEMHPDIGFAVVNCQRRPLDALAAIRQLLAFHPQLRLRLLIAVGARLDSSHWQDLPVDDVVARSVFMPEDLMALLGRTVPGDAAEAPAPEPGLPLLPTGLRVLVVEDNPVNRLVTRGLLRRLGVEPQLVEDGLQAVHCYRQQEGRFDLVLMDLDMPVMDGNTATREIRRLETAAGWPRRPVVALSAHASAEHAEQAREAGMDGQLVKPVTLQALGETVIAHCRAPAATP